MPKEETGKLIDVHAFPIQKCLPILLKDRTTDKNIIWATDAYSDLGKRLSDRNQITEERILGVHAVGLQPRILKAKEEQQKRTKKRAEVFTPAWLCCLMNNYVDEEWFGRKDVFNVLHEDHSWDLVQDKIWFPEGKTRKDYVKSPRLEITCGEAPFLVSRYDTASGELIVPPVNRIGLLDRKMRIVNENAKDYAEWRQWARKAYQSCYGFEFQGDSLLIARINMLLSYCDYFRECWGKDPDIRTVKSIAEIISWNLWQMDGLKDTVPIGEPILELEQLSLFEPFDNTEEDPEELFCKIKDWRAGKVRFYKDLKEK